MKKFTSFLTVITIGVVFTGNLAWGQNQCSSPSPLTIGANDATCNSRTFSSLGSDMDNATPPLTALSGANTCGAAIDHAASWYSFTGDGSTIRVKIFNQNQASRILVFQNATCGGTMTPAQCANFADDDLPHTLDINTVNGASYLIAVLRQSGSASMSGAICAYKTNGLPYSAVCDPAVNAQAIDITVQPNAKSCFTNFTNVVTVDDRPPVTSGCDNTQVEYWWGKFTATGTKTEFYLWGKADANATFNLATGPCSASMTNVVCSTSTGAKDKPSYYSATTVVGQEYYVLIKKPMDGGRLCVYSSTTETNKPVCTSGMSFEDGAGAGWTAKYGGYHLVSSPGTAWIWDFLSTGMPAAKFAVTSGTGVDPNVGGMVPVVAPGGGTYSFRLGSVGTAEGYAVTVPGQVTNTNNQAACESMEYCFTVNPSNAGFGYKYATIVDAPSHHPDIQPLFDVQIRLQSTGAVINCGNYVHYPGDGASPFNYVGDDGDVSSSNGIAFTPWTDVITDLSGFAGQTVCVTFRTRDCEGNKGNKDPDGNWSEMAAGSHFCYAYIDTYCVPMTITTPEYCAGTGSIQICGPPGYQTYSWPAGQPGVTGPLNGQCVTITNPSNYTGTTYTVNATSISGCPVIATVKLKSIPLTVTTPASICPGDNANISVSVDNPINPPYTFNWSHGLGTGAGPKTVSPATTTTYTVTVTNGVGCSSTQAVTVTVANCGITATATPATICEGGCGTITASGSGGTLPYTYSWNTGATTSSLSVCPTSTTTYTVTIRDNNGAGNSATATSVVTVNPKPTVTVPPATICAGSSTTLTASGANTYTWSPTTGLSSGTGTSVTANPTATSTYTVVGTTTATGCTNSTTVVVTVNPVPVVSVPPASICPGGSTPLTASGATTYTWSPATGLSATTGATVTANPAATTTYTVCGTTNNCSSCTTVTVTVGALVASVSPNAAICNGGSTNLTASGGTIFTWSPATGLSATNIANPVANPTVTTTYTVVVSDGNCSDDATVVVTVNPNPVVSVPPATICNGGSTTLTASGADTYAWSPSTGLSSSSVANPTANPTTTTTYTVVGTITATGCTGVTTVVVTVNPNPVVSVPPATICEGQNTSLTASGADTYSWSPATGLSSTTGSSVVANPTATTTYTIVGTTTATGCTGSATVVVTVIPPCGPSVAATGATVCDGVCATVNSTATAGIPPYTYSWNTGETTTSINVCPLVTTTYTIIVTDNSTPVETASAIAVVTVNPIPVISVPPATVCNGASAILTASGAITYSWSPATGLSSTTGSSVTANPSTTTTYTVVGNSLGCTASTTVEVTVNPVPVVSSSNASICPGSSTTLSASGCNTYSWSPATGLSATTGATVTASPTTTTTYTVVGTTNGCSNSTTVVVIVNIIVADAGPDKFVCDGGSTTLTASGGTIFTWTPATGLSATNISNPVANPTVTTTYTVNVSDGFCSDDDEVVVTVNPPITLNSSGIDATCFGLCNGQIIVIPAGGTAPYSYAWSNGCNLAACSNVCAGAYTLVTTDAVGCTASASATVNQPSALNVALTGATNVSCFGLCDGSASVSASGGTTPYSYAWSPTGGPAANAPALCAGSYTCTVTDNNSCTVATSVVITQPTRITVSANSAQICPDFSTTLNASATGGSGGFTFTWSPATGLSSTTGSSVTASPSSTTIYTVTATDINGCSSGTSITVTVNPAPIVSVPAAAICEGTTTSLTASGANTYSWSPATGLSATTGANVIAGPNTTTTYTVMGTSALGCTASTTVIVTVNPRPVMSATGGNACPGDSIPLSVSGANSYSWSPAIGLSSTTASNVIATPPVTTLYTVIGTGTNGCTSSITVTATVNPKPVAAFTTSPDVVDIFNPTIYFYDNSTNTSTWNWNFGDSANTISTLQNPVFKYPDTPAYYNVRLIVTSPFGCVDTITVTVFIRDIYTFYIPNTFTPNGDGVNDVFLPKGVGIDEEDYHLWIFDRWGNLIWQTETWGQGWDGKANGGANIAQIDTYVWKVHVREKDSGNKHDYIGHVNIVK